MKYFQTIAFALIGLLFSVKSFSQDSLYAKRIDSLWLHSYDTHLLSKKRTTNGNAKVENANYKSSGKMRSIVSLNKAKKENLIFFYIEDKPVMISPSGQPPYFILNDSLVYAKQLKHTSEQVQELIARAYNYLEFGYNKVKGQRDGRR